jgi:hypothetical protein
MEQPSIWTSAIKDATMEQPSYQAMPVKDVSMEQPSYVAPAAIKDFTMKEISFDRPSNFDMQSIAHS